MLWVGVFILLILLPAYVAGQLMVATAKCLPGYTWVCLIDCWITFHSITCNLSLDFQHVESESLRRCCFSSGSLRVRRTLVSCLAFVWCQIYSKHTEFDFDPLPSGYVYWGPRAGNATPCSCSTVSYSLLSACGYCQSRSFLE